MQDEFNSRQLPLAGIRVLDFGRYIAGPYCAALLGEFGADVIRIEKRAGSEDRFVTPVTENGDGALFLQMNRNKRSLTVNPTSEAGKKIVRKLIETADVVVANLPASTLQSMGISYAQLREIKPEIILATVSAFGDEGDWSERVGFDSVAQAMCGAAYLSGDKTPSRSQASWVDFGTAVHSAFGVAIALLDRKRSGFGQQVSSTLLGTALTMMSPQLIEQDLVAPNREPLGNDAAGAAPIGMFESRDGWIACHVVGQPLFERLVQLLDKQEWLANSLFANDTLRGENRQAILESVSAWCRQRSRDEILDAMAAVRIPAGPVLSLQEALDHPQSQAINLFQPVHYDGLSKPVRIARAPVRLSTTPTQLKSPPKLGADTESILQSLGYDRMSIQRFRKEGTI